MFECHKSIKNVKKNTWNIRLLVDDSFVPSSKQPSVIYCRLTDFTSKILPNVQWLSCIDTGHKWCILCVYPNS